MITRIEIDGFKSFTDFGLDLEPFTIVAGVNGVGKSNLFDALRHVRRLVGGGSRQGPPTLRSAFESTRGSLHDLFTWHPDGSRSDRMRFALELLLPESVRDPYGVEKSLVHRRVRYEVEVSIDHDAPRLVFERLRPIPRQDDAFLKRHDALGSTVPSAPGGKRPDFIGTEEDRIFISQDQRGGRKHPIPLAATTSTALSSISDVTFPHAYATKRALTDLRFLHLEPDALRAPSPWAAPTDLGSDGSGLPAALARMAREVPDALDRVSTAVGRIVPGLVRVRVDRDEVREEHSLTIEHADGYELPARLVSDGTLRLVALATMVHDPNVVGSVILEEPENGIYAGRIPELLDLLHGFVRAPHARGKERQLLANTHSIPLVQAMRNRGLTESLLFASLKRVVRSDRPLHRATVIAAVDPDTVQEPLFREGEGDRRRVAYQEMERLLQTAPAPDVP
jgi:predicted ATPase